MGTLLKNNWETTINDIARVARVSKATVSLVMKGSPKISSKTRDKVMAVIRILRYQPNEEARKLAQRRWTGSSRIGFEVVPSDEIFPPG